MPRDDVGILRYGATDLKGGGRNLLHWVTILMAGILFCFRFFHSDPYVFAIRSQALNAQRPILNSEPGNA
jgi:hypothetical protein